MQKLEGEVKERTHCLKREGNVVSGAVGCPHTSPRVGWRLHDGQTTSSPAS